MVKKLLFLLALFCTVGNAQQLKNPQQTLNQTDKSFFIQNKGQWNPEVKYLARIGGMNAWITNSGVVYDYYRIKKNFDETKTTKMNPREMQDYENKNTLVDGHVVRMQLVNAEKEVISVGNNQREGYYNYFISNDKSKWASYVPLYDNVEVKGIYKNIDVKYYYDNRMLRYDYIVKPGADVSRIIFKFDGQEGMNVNSKGELVLKTSIGEVTNGKLYAYQMEGETQKEVECTFEQREDGAIGLKATGYDANKELIIDPLVYSTFIGGSGDDQGYSIAIDVSGNAYITGAASSQNYPTTPGAYQTNFNGTGYVTKLNSNGNGLVYSTFIGGNSTFYSIAIDKGGNAFITGRNNSPDYPTTIGAFQTTYGGSVEEGGISQGDAVVTKLNTTGSGLIYSTYIGGSSNEMAFSIAVDVEGNAYVTGTTNSKNYPTTSGAFQKSFGGGIGDYFTGDGFVTKLNSTGSALVYSTFMGGSNNDHSYSIAVDAAGDAYITGQTYSSDYPTTPGVFQTTYVGGYNTFGDAFVTKLNSIGSGLVYSTFIGDTGEDQGNSIAVDAGGNAYITGLTNSLNYPTTPGAYQTNFISTGGMQYSSVFVTKINPTGSGLVYSTFIGGGGGGDQGYSIAIDGSGNSYITGVTSSTIFPTTSGAFQKSYGGRDVNYFGGDAFITELNPTGNELIYSTYLGGHLNDYGNSIAIDASGNAFITGSARSSNYPTTPGSFQSIYGGDELYGDAFVTKLNIPQTTLTHDVGVLKIIGANQFTGGSQYYPSVQIQNLGASNESFNVICKIYDYNGNVLTQSTQAVTNLASDSIQTVIFTPYALNDNYLYKVEFNTQLTEDLNTDNNSISKYINTYSAIKKNVLVEIATETTCPFAPGVQSGANDLINNGKKCAIIGYFMDNDFEDRSNYGYSNWRYNWYGWGGIPAAIFDGIFIYVGENTCIGVYNSYLPFYDSVYSIRTPLDISITGNAASVNDYNVTFHVRKLAPFIEKNIVLFAALTENKIPFTWMGQTEVDYCERWMFPDFTKGYPIDLVYNDSVSVPISLTTKSSWLLANLELSVWVQDLYTKEIFNTTKIKLIDFSTWQADINVKDNGNVSQSLTFGKSPIGTDGIDIDLGEAPLPPPPFGFDARFHLPTGDDSWKDYRLADNDSIEWLIKFQPGNGGYPITFSWNPVQLPSTGSFYLKDLITGTIVNVNMKTDSSYTLTNSGINALKIELKLDVVPIELTSFAANLFENNVNITWETSTEKNNSGFEIQRSKDGNVYDKIGFVKGNGTTAEIHTYVFTDKNVPSRKIYYRLKQIDYNGTANYSNAIEVFQDLPIVFSLSQNYPNPFNPSTVIKYGLPGISNVQIKIYNLVGQEVESLVNGTQNAGYHEVTWNASTKTSGIYFYTLEAIPADGKGNFRSTKKLILMK
ncbi:MAG: SBBP repeat-containing protein [Ignavibacteriales bacterium]|nr:SBBP repeat-containing protein [Ignavibacteriales bacterium]